MMSKALVDRNGKCPYCFKGAFDEETFKQVRPNFTVMQCLMCSRWSVNKRPQNYQYPLQDPSDMDSPMTTMTQI